MINFKKRNFHHKKICLNKMNANFRLKKVYIVRILFEL